ncbi:F0F1 ATP synthase subunit gamma [Salinisphaera sp. SPP-AMP-43]|uniref:F0F1 ATP synthase subunit gamma n=1 Tax=Salinisphaera sp. SPP-AMP-43 TaxID=3121288 RepID=UPI003C6DBEB8
MTTGAEALRRRLADAQELAAVVRAMKALAAGSVGQYEQAVRALGDYEQTLERALAARLRQAPPASVGRTHAAAASGAIVFGSDQGLVGRFNEALMMPVAACVPSEPGGPVWAIGERVYALLVAAGYPQARLLWVPTTVQAITPLVDRLLVEVEAARERGDVHAVHIVYNRQTASATHAGQTRRLLPLDEIWRARLVEVPWPTHTPPQVIDALPGMLSTLIRAYLFAVLFRACAESLASEHASRLAAMQRAERNIDERLESLHRQAQTMRQTAIDEELFDLIAGSEALMRRGPDGR